MNFIGLVKKIPCYLRTDFLSQMLLIVLYITIGEE